MSRRSATLSSSWLAMRITSIVSRLPKSWDGSQRLDGAVVWICICARSSLLPTTFAFKVTTPLRCSDVVDRCLTTRSELFSPMNRLRTGQGIGLQGRSPPEAWGVPQRPSRAGGWDRPTLETGPPSDNCAPDLLPGKRHYRVAALVELTSNKQTLSLRSPSAHHESHNAALRNRRPTNPIPTRSR